jgi:hypothetical protein
VLRRDGSLPAAKLLPFAEPLLGAGDEASGDNEAAGQSLAEGLDRVRRMKNVDVYK